MKPLFLLLSLSFSLTLAAQNKFHFGALISPALSGNILSNDGTILIGSGTTVKTTKMQTYGYYGYLFSQYKINTKWSIQTGVGYSRNEYITGKKSNALFAEPNDPLAIKYTPFIWTHQDIIVPVLLRHNLTRKKNNFYLIGGATLPIKLKRIKKQEAGYILGTAIAEEDSDPATIYRKINLNGTLGVGYDLQLSSKTSLFFQPTFDCNLLDTAKSGSLNRKIYSIGLNIGMSLF